MIKLVKIILTKIKIRRIAKKVVDVGYRNTTTGNYNIDFSEAAELGKTSLDFVLSHKREISDLIDKDKRILSETWVDNDFDMNFCWEEHYED